MQLFALDPAVFFLGYGGYAEAMEGLADCISCGYAEATIVEVSYAEAIYPSAQTAYLEGVLMLSKKNVAVDGFVEGISSF